MARSKKNTAANQSVVEDAPHSMALAHGGVKTTENYRDVMASLMADILAGRVSPQVANAVCNVGKCLVRVVDMEYKYAGLSNQHRNILPMALHREKK